MPVTTITLGAAMPTDAGAISACVDAAYRRYIPRIGQAPGPMLADYPALIAAKRVTVAVQGDQIVGVLVTLPANDHLLLDNIAVHPDCQGSGLGRRLIDHAEAEAVSQGYSRIQLYTHEAMTENQALYLRFGYREIERRRERGFDRVYFEKSL